MTTTDAKSATPADAPANEIGSFLLPWTNRILEALWLLTVFLVPLIYLDKGYSVSEAEISYVEVPKVAVLRTLAGLIALVWLVEWAIKSKMFQGPPPSITFAEAAEILNPAKTISALRIWLKGHPIRWLLLAAGMFFASTLLSTVLSGSFTTSMWGEIPGQDGYSAYTVASYGVLFGVIATHLRGRTQMVRLVGAVILMGVLAGLYGVLQHYDHDFLGISELTGGGATRTTVFMGNAIFAGAVLAMTVPVTLVAAATTFREENWGDSKLLARFDQLHRDAILTFIWASALGVQLLGLMFTFSRGPWSGAALALVAFLGLVVLAFGFRMLVRTGLVIGLATMFAGAVLHWQGDLSIIDFGSWVALVIALLGLGGAYATLYVIQNFGRLVMYIAVVGVVVSIIGTAVIAPAAFSSDDGDAASDGGAESLNTGIQVSERISSIKTDVLGGFVGGRGTHWKVSWDLIKNRPWFEFDELSLSWLRPLIGYGPDLFRYTYLIRSPAEEIGFKPLEPDHAHNFFIHQTVEQGIFGGIASLALFGSVFGVVGHHLLRRRRAVNPFFQVLLIGMMAVILGRFLEMMVGVARISDLTVLWVIFALFAALIRFDDGQEGPAEPARNQTASRVGRRERRIAARMRTSTSYSADLAIRLAVLALIFGGIGVVTWQKSINSVRASLAEGRALAHFREGDFENSIIELDNAIRLAPGVPNYYNNRASVFFNYQLQADRITEPGCDEQDELPYLVCLGLESLESNLESVNKQPFNYRARLAAGTAAFNLQLNESAIDSYTRAASMVSNSFSIRNNLAESQINNGDYVAALVELERSLEITGDSIESTAARYLHGRAFRGLGRTGEALSTLGPLARGADKQFAQFSLELMREIHTDENVDQDIGYFDNLIRKNAEDSIAYYLRGMIQLHRGEAEKAFLDIDESRRLGLHPSEAQANTAYARLQTGDPRAIQVLMAVVAGDPRNALFRAYLAENHLAREEFDQALNQSEIAIKLDPELGLAYLVRAKAYLTLELEQLAEEAIGPSGESDLPAASHYIDRAGLHAFFGDYDLAFADLDRAIAINQDKADYYDARARIHANNSDFLSALEDFNSAIGLDESNSEFFKNRGLVYDILGDTTRSTTDYEVAESLDPDIFVLPVDLSESYFAIYPEITPAGVDRALFIKQLADRRAQETIDRLSAIPPRHHTKGGSFLPLGEAYFRLELWQDAIDNFDEYIRRFPENSPGFRARGGVYLALQRHDQAITDYDNAINLNSADIENFLARGIAYSDIGAFERALADFNRAIELDPDFSSAHESRGFLSARTGNRSEGLVDINNAISISPLNHSAYFKRALIQADLGQLTVALADLDLAIKLAPANSQYLHGRGLLRFAMGDNNLAIQDFDRAIAISRRTAAFDPQHARPFFDRGRTYLQSGNLERTVADANRAIELFGGNLIMPVWENYAPTLKLLKAESLELLGDAYTEMGNDADAQAAYQQAAYLR